jgi:cysteine desulfurase
MQPDWIYLDHNATTAPTPEVVEAVTHALSQVWANASSSHPMGQLARQALAQARAQVARFLGCKPAEVVFTSGATEANHIALRGALARDAAAGKPRSHLVLSRAEHAGVRKFAATLAGQHDVSWIGLRPDGTLDLAAARALLTAGTTPISLVSVMAANNETGVLMPIAELAELVHAQGALLHVDATQLVGKLPFDFATSGADLVSVSAHKFHGPKGVGALLVRQGLSWPALMPGSQERGRRGGTENLPGIVGFGVAAEQLSQDTEAWQASIKAQAALRDRLEAGLQTALPGTVVFGTNAPRLPNTSYLRFGGVHADVVLTRLERLGVMASSGAACSAGGNEPSPVLLAMGVAPEEALCAVRLTLGSQTRADEIDSVLKRLSAELAPLVSPTGVFA